MSALSKSLIFIVISSIIGPVAYFQMDIDESAFGDVFSYKRSYTSGALNRCSDPASSAGKSMLDTCFTIVREQPFYLIGDEACLIVSSEKRNCMDFSEVHTMFGRINLEFGTAYDSVTWFRKLKSYEFPQNVNS